MLLQEQPFVGSLILCFFERLNKLTQLMNLSFILLAIKEMFYVNLSPHVKPRANYKISE